MNETEELKMIESSLDLKPRSNPLRMTVSQPDLLSSFLAISTALLKVNSQLDGLQAELKRANDSVDTYARLDYEVKQVASKVDLATSKIVSLSAIVSDRLKTVDVLEAKYNKLISNVTGVLAKLEKVI